MRGAVVGADIEAALIREDAEVGFLAGHDRDPLLVPARLLEVAIVELVPAPAVMHREHEEAAVVRELRAVEHGGVTSALSYRPIMLGVVAELVIADLAVAVAIGRRDRWVGGRPGVIEAVALGRPE